MKEKEKPKEAEEIRELIRVKIDIYGLTMEDIQDILSRAQKMAERPQRK